VDKAHWDRSLFECFGFLCQSLFHQMLHTHLSNGTGTIGQLVADVPSGLTVSPTTSHEIRNTGFNIRRLLRLVGLRWRNCNPLPRGDMHLIHILNWLLVNLVSTRNAYCPISVCSPRICMAEERIATNRRSQDNSYSAHLSHLSIKKQA
jgi:hypothetical protein